VAASASDSGQRPHAEVSAEHVGPLFIFIFFSGIPSWDGPKFRLVVPVCFLIARCAAHVDNKKTTHFIRLFLKVPSCDRDSFDFVIAQSANSGLEVAFSTF